MRLRLFATILLLATALGPSSTAAANGRATDSLWCGGALVEVGDSAVALLNKCGDPSLREERLVEYAPIVPLDDGSVLVEPGEATVVERWTYNFGPDRFIEVVTVEGGHVRAVKSGGYGYPLDQVPVTDPSRCPGGVHVRDTALDVLGKCGEPSRRDTRTVQRSTVVAASTGAGQAQERVTVVVDTWTYDLGPGRLLVVITLDGGRVVSIERGGFGAAN